MSHCLISLSHPKLSLETVLHSASDAEALSTRLSVQTPQQGLRHTSPSRLDALVAWGFSNSKVALLEGRDGDAATPKPSASLKVFTSLGTFCCRLMCAPKYLSSPRPCDVWPHCCPSPADDWKTWGLQRKPVVEQAWSWLFRGLTREQFADHKVLFQHKWSYDSLIIWEQAKG